MPYDLWEDVSEGPVRNERRNAPGVDMGAFGAHERQLQGTHRKGGLSMEGKLVMTPSKGKASQRKQEERMKQSKPKMKKQPKGVLKNRVVKEFQHPMV